MNPKRVAIVGAGPAGLMAAEKLLAAGLQVDVFDSMPSAGRKFLLAGKGGLNLTHSEAIDAFRSRYGQRQSQVAQWLDGFDAHGIRDWVKGLGIETFVGSSGRVFPQEMKAAPLLRAWLHRLRAQGLRLNMRHRWQGWPDPFEPTRLGFDSPAGDSVVTADAVVLALGGASWPQLGSTGAWVPMLLDRGVDVAALTPSNCGFDVSSDLSPGGWSPWFAERFAGTALKTVRLRFDDDCEPPFERIGEFVITATGIEGSLVYAASARIREAIARKGQAVIELDLLPGRSVEKLIDALGRHSESRSMANRLRVLGLDSVRAALLRERWDADRLHQQLAGQPRPFVEQLKSWPVRLTAPRPIAEAISTAGGVRFEAMTPTGMLKALPGVFCAGEMLDWEAPTGGYLLTACLASGANAAQGVISHLASTTA